MYLRLLQSPEIIRSTSYISNFNSLLCFSHVRYVYCFALKSRPALSQEYHSFKRRFSQSRFQSYLSSIIISKIHLSMQFSSRFTNLHTFRDQSCNDFVCPIKCVSESHSFDKFIMHCWNSYTLSDLLKVILIFVSCTCFHKIW